MYELPGLKNVGKVVIDESVIIGDSRPYIVYRADDPKLAPVEERRTGSTWASASKVVTRRHYGVSRVTLRGTP